MSRSRQIVIVAMGVALAAAAAGEHLSRRLIERRLAETQEGRRHLELQFGEFVATHERVRRDLEQEQQRSRELSEVLTAVQAKLQETTQRVQHEARTVRELQLRVANLQQQANQLQGELAMTLQRVGQTTAGTKDANAVQLERVVVSDAKAAPSKGRVLSVHRDWNFVVINFGWDTVHIGDTVSIFRQDQILAKARIERVQEGVCAATLLPEWEASDVRVNDVVQIL